MDEVEREIEKTRTEINQLDLKIIGLLGERMKLILHIGKIKHSYNLKKVSHEREKEVFRTRMARGKKNDLREKFIKKLYLLIMKESRIIEKKLRTD
jgi:chorismate mutase